MRRSTSHTRSPAAQRQRICIARALAMEPEALIADEAVSALDGSVRAQMLKLLEEVLERVDLTMLRITHDLRGAARIFDRIVVIHSGEAVEAGETGPVPAAPADSFTRAGLTARLGQAAGVPGHAGSGAS